MRELVSKRGSAALSMLLEALDAGVSIVVIDARQVLETWWEREGDSRLERLGPTPEQEARREALEAGQAARIAWEAAWQRDEERKPLGGGEWVAAAALPPRVNYEARAWFTHRETGERLASTDWQGCAETVREVAYAAALSAARAVRGLLDPD